jgi:hypothetical protein
MNLEQIKNLPDGMKDRYSKLEAIFNSPGWDLVIEWAKARREGAEQRQLHASVWDHVLVNRGAGFAYAELETLRDTTEAEFAALAEAEAERLLQEDEFEHE